MRRDRSREVGEVLLQFVAKLDLHERRDERQRGAAHLRGGSRSTDQRQPGAGLDRINDVVAFVVKATTVAGKSQAPRSFDFYDLHFLRRLVAKHDALCAYSRAHADGPELSNSRLFTEPIIVDHFPMSASIAKAAGGCAATVLVTLICTGRSFSV